MEPTTLTKEEAIGVLWGLGAAVGLATFFVLLAALFVFGIRWAVKHNKFYLKIALWSADGKVALTD